MDSTSSEKSEEKSPPLLGSPTNCDVEWAEVINPGVGKRRRLVCESLLWEVGWFARVLLKFVLELRLVNFLAFSTFGYTTSLP